MASLLLRLRAYVCSPAYIAITYKGIGTRSGGLPSLFLQDCILWHLILRRLHCYETGNSFFRFHRISNNAPRGCSKSHICRLIDSFPAVPGDYSRNSLLSQAYSLPPSGFTVPSHFQKSSHTGTSSSRRLLMRSCASMAFSVRSMWKSQLQ